MGSTWAALGVKAEAQTLATWYEGAKNKRTHSGLWSELRVGLGPTTGSFQERSQDRVTLASDPSVPECGVLEGVLPGLR